MTVALANLPLARYLGPVDRRANRGCAGLPCHPARQVAFAGPGGSTPSPVYARLAQADIGWDRRRVTLVDERYVPK